MIYWLLMLKEMCGIRDSWIRIRPNLCEYPLQECGGGKRKSPCDDGIHWELITP